MRHHFPARLLAGPARPGYRTGGVPGRLSRHGKPQGAPGCDRLIFPLVPMATGTRGRLHLAAGTQRCSPRSTLPMKPQSASKPQRTAWDGMGRPQKLTRCQAVVATACGFNGWQHLAKTLGTPHEPGDARDKDLALRRFDDAPSASGHARARHPRPVLCHVRARHRRRHTWPGRPAVRRGARAAALARVRPRAVGIRF